MRNHLNLRYRERKREMPPFCAEADVEEALVQRRLGHASAEMTRGYKRRGDRFSASLTRQVCERFTVQTAALSVETWATEAQRQVLKRINLGLTHVRSAIK